MIVQRIEQLHRDEGVAYRTLCARESLGYSNFTRWKGRLRRGEPTVSKPGAGKVEPLDWDALRDQISALRHGAKRTAGTGELYQLHRDQISRRDLGVLVKAERQRVNTEQRRICHEVRWKAPRLIWAMDDTEYQPDKMYPKAYLNNVRDLGSRYTFAPLVGTHLAHGDEVAAHLAELFTVHGPPLFLKRDNGGNLNHRQVDELLAKAMVLPLNSPCHYPLYNGGVERAQREVKESLDRHTPVHPFLAIQAELDVQAMNHRRRPCLHRHTSCEVFAGGRELARTFTRRKRREVYDQIKKHTIDLIAKEDYDPNTAWRHAVETWLLNNGLITLCNNQRV